MKPAIIDKDENIHFDHMTPAQKNAMNYVAFSGFSTSIIPSQVTLKHLCDLGLVEVHKRIFGTGWDAVESIEYSMPIHVHAMWCDYVGGKNEY